jgi:hypothetical protein
MGHQLGDKIEKVEEAAIYEYPNNAKNIKVKVQFNISDPIRAGMYIGNENDGINWADFRYENLPLFCFRCGLIGHSNHNVPKDMLDMMANLQIKKAWANQGNKDGTPTNSANMQGWNAQTMQTPKPLKRKFLPASHTIQVQRVGQTLCS